MEPLRLGPLSLGIGGYQFADGRNDDDVNWLVADVSAEAPGVLVRFSDPCLQTGDLLRFHDALDALIRDETAEARLLSSEPFVAVAVRQSGNLGHYTCNIRLVTPASDATVEMNARIDQTDIHAAIAVLKSMNRRFPVRTP